METLPTIFHITVVTILGACLGSFCSAILYREEKGLSWFSARSKSSRSSCPQCDHVLSAKDLVPLLSWLMQRGRCRYCQGVISWRYPVLELLCILLAVCVYYVVGFSISGFMAMALIPFVTALFILIFKTGRAPRRLTIISVVLAGLFGMSSVILL